MKNVGRMDASIRVVVGFIIIVLGMVYQSWWGAIGLVFILTAYLNFCPLYPLLKINTRKQEQPKK
jgi:hypothetical protein